MKCAIVHLPPSSFPRVLTKFKKEERVKESLLYFGKSSASASIKKSVEDSPFAHMECAFGCHLANDKNFLYPPPFIRQRDIKGKGGKASLAPSEGGFRAYPGFPLLRFTQKKKKHNSFLEEKEREGKAKEV